MNITTKRKERGNKRNTTIKNFKNNTLLSLHGRSLETMHNDKVSLILVLKRGKIRKRNSIPTPSLMPKRTKLPLQKGVPATAATTIRRNGQTTKRRRRTRRRRTWTYLNLNDDDLPQDLKVHLVLAHIIPGWKVRRI